MRDYSNRNVRSFAGKWPQLGARVLIDPSAVVLGDVELGDDVSVWPQAVIRGDMHRIRVGARSSVQDGSVLHITHAGPYNPGGWPLSIGMEVTIGHNATLHGCAIGDRVLVGMGAIVMDGAVVEDEVVIAAGALVTPGKTLRRGFLYGGSPAREMRPLSEAELGYFSYSASNYVKLKERHLTELAAPAGTDGPATP
ncbi:gamma carbonic anhydrase family protein [Kineobactrum salinum]|uniref:Gamma carbonic anhydrase family protein n=1 Tax=Kineobactrum salinum TaxID=2708301 RepID=A0A6C0U0X2_9GAMM|nr:gamma carbonic anhydrase family protein [Kineobactrum salinum]QIB65666.1 gamma carbonic anhydrase family protein [Kineobactrum salinum]